MTRGFGYVLSEPVRVHWRGWESNTTRLGQAGWQISAHEDAYNDRLAVAIRHPDTGMTGVSYAATYHYHRLRDRGRGNWLELPFELEMEAMGRAIYSQALARTVGVGPMSRGTGVSWRAIDPFPQYMEIEEAKRIEDIVHFASLEKKKDIIIRPESVPELMEKILKLQQPMREQHFRERAKEARANTTVHARLISLTG